MKRLIYNTKAKLLLHSKIAVIFGVLLLLHSCELVGPIEDIEPYYQLTEETAFINGKSTESVLDGVYVGWKQGYIQLYTAQTMLLSGNYAPNSLGEDMYLNDVDIESSYLSTYYKSYYSIIQRANFVIKATSSDREIFNLTETRRTEIEAEARLHRAITHFILLRSFGQFYDLDSEIGIVLSDYPISGDINIPRSNIQECYNFILEDLDFAIENAPASAVAGRFTKHTAKAFKAKVLLYQQDWSGAAALALETINSGEYDLRPDIETLYAEGYESSEVIFSPISIAPYGLSFGGSYVYSPGEALIKAADKSIGTDSDGNIETGEGYDPRFAYAHTGDLPRGIYNNKYPFLQVSGEKDASLFILRLGEIYLIYAEAKARLTSGTGVDTDALAKLNDIRERAGLTIVEPSTKAELLEDIRLEKQLELFGEFNEPWFDMIRYHILGDVNITDLKSTVTNKNQFILPIPPLALAGNGGLEQNPGY